jgi:hypothetical protein
MLSKILVGLSLFSSAVALSSNTTCVCTTVPCPVAGPNYLSAGGGGQGIYNYVTHSGYAVVSTVSVSLGPKDLGTGTDTTSCTQSYSRMLDDDGVQDCDAGHILANHLGGAGNQPINIFPQDLSINRGSYAQFEGDIYDCIDGGASSALLSWTFTYESSTHTKPNKVDYAATFTGGPCTSLHQTFTN